MKTPDTIRKDVLIGSALMITAFACFFNVVSLGFFSDDFYVMHRLTIKKEFWGVGFFRPLSDVSLLFNYYIGGYNAWGYRVTNIILHGFNAFVLYKTIRLSGIGKAETNFKTAFIASFLFVTYPFHSESIIWIVGRASLLANTFGIVCLYIFVSDLSYRKKTILISACYFIGLLSYESILVIPGIIFMAVYARQKKLKPAFLFMIPLTLVLIFHLILRWLISGVIFGNYGIDMFGEGQTNYALKFLKSSGRLFIPGLHNSTLLVILFSFVFFLIILSFFLVYRYKKNQLGLYTLLWSFLLIAHIVPVMFGVDTHTSDGDRLLYLPSFFLCSVIAFIITLFIANKKVLVTISILLVACNFYLQQKVNSSWIKADAITIDILSTVNSNCCSNPLYIANLPDAEEGSFIFRNGFHEAMAIKKFPDSNVIVLNYLKTQQAVLLPDTIMAQKMGAGIYIVPPVITVNGSSVKVDSASFNHQFTKAIEMKPGGIFLYWNKNKLVPLP